MIKALLRTVVIALTCVVAALLAPHQVLDGPITARKVADVALRDDRGRVYRLADVSANGSIVLIGYTRCGDQCPLAMARVTATVAGLARPHRPRIVFLTIDPAHDTAADLRRFTSMWAVPVVGLTGNVKDIERALTSLGSAMPSPRALTLHDSRVAFIAPDGEVRASVGSDASDAIVSEALRSIGDLP
jgi:protein SCO1/2